jgi:hypothetical protein
LHSCWIIVFFVCCSCFYFIVCAFKMLFGKGFGKENIKEIEKKGKGGSPPCRPGGPASAWLSPPNPRPSLRPRASRRAPLPSLSLLSAADDTGPRVSAYLLLPSVDEPVSAGRLSSAEPNPGKRDFLANLAKLRPFKPLRTAASSHLHPNRETEP